MHKNSGNDMGLVADCDVNITVRNAILFENNVKTHM